VQWTEESIEHVYRVIGSRVRAARRKKRWNQADLADAVGLTRSSIANVEAGRQRLLVHATLRVADALEVPIDSLLPTAEEITRNHDSNRISPDLTGQPDSTQEFINAALRRATKG
jgi:transcriptional regulator with XRE-family HTH domain